MFKQAEGIKRSWALVEHKEEISFEDQGRNLMKSIKKSGRTGSSQLRSLYSDGEMQAFAGHNLSGALSRYKIWSDDIHWCFSLRDQ